MCLCCIKSAEVHRDGGPGRYPLAGERHHHCRPGFCLRAQFVSRTYPLSFTWHYTPCGYSRSYRHSQCETGFILEIESHGGVTDAACIAVILVEDVAGHHLLP